MVKTDGLPVGVAGGFAALVVLLWMGAVGQYAQAEPKAEKINPNASAPLMNGWKAFWENRFEASVKTLDNLAGSRSSDSWQAKHCQARAWWALGDAQAQRKAKMLWAQLARGARLDPYAAARVEIGKALMQMDRGRADQAISQLQALVDEDLSSIVTAEAQIELALALAIDGKTDKGLEQLDAADAFLALSESHGIPKGLQKIFQDAVEKVRQLIKTPGRMEFEKACALASAKRYDSALDLFNLVIERYPKSDYAMRSEVEIGHCLVGMNRIPQAIAQWQQFISIAPSGSWRAQAYVGVVDTYIEYELNLAEAQRHLTMAIDSLPAGLKGKLTSESWTLAVYDLRLREGGLALLQNRHTNAKQAFEAASKTEGVNQNHTQGIKDLIEIAEAKRPAAPVEIDANKPSPSLPLAMETIYQTAGQRAHAVEIINRIITGKCGRPSREEMAFAYFEQARLADRGQVADKARAIYAKSYQTYPEGSWHDRTLFRLAKLTQKQIDRKFKQVIKLLDDPKAVAKANAGQQRKITAYTQAQREVLDYWTKLVEGFPGSLYMEPALRHAGRLYAQASLWSDAAALWTRHGEVFPASPWAGYIYIHLIDLQLEHLYDLDVAIDTSEAAIAWVKLAKKDMLLLPTDVATPADPDRKVICHGIYLRAGLVAYLDQKYEQSVACFEAAKPFRQEKRDFKVVQGHIPTGLERVIEAARAQRKLTPSLVLEGDPKAKLIMQLADIYLQASQWNKTIDLCDVVINTREFVPTPQQKSWAHHQRGTAVYGIPECKKALDDYLLAQKACPTAPWAAESLFYSGTITNNFHQDYAGAAKLFESVLSKYPKSEVADKAAYFVGVAYEWDEDWPKARIAYEAFLQRYPQSQWVRLVQNRHMPTVMKNLAAKND